MPISRRKLVGLPLAALVLQPVFAEAASEAAILTRAIPSTGERLPAVGLGTASVFDRDDSETRRRAADVVQALVTGGGRLIDTGSTYGNAESVLGAVVQASKLRDRALSGDQGRGAGHQ